MTGHDTEMYRNGITAACDVAHISIIYAGSLASFAGVQSMPDTRRINMRKIRDVLRLKLEAKLSHQQIAAALDISKGVVTKYAALA